MRSGENPVYRANPLDCDLLLPFKPCVACLQLHNPRWPLGPRRSSFRPAALPAKRAPPWGAGAQVPGGLHLDCLESVSELDQGLQSFRNMRRIEASFKNARALRLRFSQSLARRRQRMSQAIVRSTIQRPIPTHGVYRRDAAAQPQRVGFAEESTGRKNPLGLLLSSS